MNPSECIKELKTDSTLWTTPARIINLLAILIRKN